MFDIGFWELTVIAVMGLVILGPERLPTALRSVMKTVRSVRSMAQNVKEDISQELHLHELHENLKKAEDQGLEDLSPELQNSLDELRRAADSVKRPYRQGVKQEGTKESSDQADKAPERSND